MLTFWHFAEKQVYIYSLLLSKQVPDFNAMTTVD